MNLLIFFMSLACHKHHVALLSHRTCLADGFTAVDNALNSVFFCNVNPAHHVIDDGLRVFKTRIVTRENHKVALTDSLSSHQRTFAFVAVATRTTDS